MRLKLFGVATTALLLTACASNVPEPIRQEISSAPTLAQVRAEPDRFEGAQVRWGGVILDTENKDDGSWVKVIAMPLKGSGKPRDADNSPGRFVAVVDRFLEPLLYARDRRITFTGQVIGTQSEKIGEFSYQYPIIRADFYHLWPKDPPRIDDPYPPHWYYDPWWYHPIHYPRYPVRLIPHPR